MSSTLPIIDDSLAERQRALAWEMSRLVHEVRDLAWTVRDLVGEVFPRLPDERDANRAKDTMLGVHHRLTTLAWSLGEDGEGDILRRVEELTGFDLGLTRGGDQ